MTTELVTDLDLSDEIDALPKHSGYSTLPPRSGEQYGTFHYSGVVYGPTDRAGEIQRVLDEAAYQLQHNYGSAGAPAYPDGFLYDVTVFQDGCRVKTRKKPVQLWHCGNASGNRSSYSVHVMLGPNQDTTEAQWAGVVNIFEQICSIHGIPRVNIVGHNEWPRHDGAPLPSSTYKILPEQSECPGKVLHSRLANWRAQPTDPLKARQIPGPHGTYYNCGTGFYDFYTKSGGFDLFGYALSDEIPIVGLDGRKGTGMVWERADPKYIEGEGVHLMLLSEAQALGLIR